MPGWTLSSSYRYSALHAFFLRRMAAVHTQVEVIERIGIGSSPDCSHAGVASRTREVRLFQSSGCASKSVITRDWHVHASRTIEPFKARYRDGCLRRAVVSFRAGLDFVPLAVW